MHKVIIASNNKHKISEITSVLAPVSGLKLYSLKDFGITVDVIEDGDSLEENALIKAKKINSILKLPSLADDTGLFVDALNGDPGVYSARYAGENATYEDNCNKLISGLSKFDKSKRSAEFISVICFFVNDNEYYFFKGICKGEIINESRGKNGFGYDPLFVPEELDKTFAELSDEEKNKISHRAIALKKFKDFCSSYFQ
jgi:XTP/dITP diphosphohydrolase